MSVNNKRSCPYCGQSINERQISLFKGMVEALHEVFMWCQEKNIHEFSRKEIKHLLKSDNQIARFGDWVMFGGLVYKRSKGHYGLNIEKTTDFFKGKREIPTIIYKNPITKTIRPENYKTIDNIPSLAHLLDKSGDYVVDYSGPSAVSWLNDK